MLRRTELRRTPLARTSGLTRSHRLPAASVGRRAGREEQARVYAEAAKTEDPWCACCGRPGDVEHSHLYSQGRFAQHRNNPLNWLLKCRACHDLFEHDKTGFAARYPAVWAEILRRLPLIDEAAFAEFQLKHDC